MSAKILVPIAIIGGIAAVMFMMRRAEAAPLEIPTTKIPTASDIMQTRNIAELDAYYDYVGQLFIIGKITLEEYRTLYDAYYTRWQELTGVNE